MANTTNLDLVKPAGTDHALISVLNSNSDKIDAFAGQTNDSLSAEQNGLAYIVGNTNTTGGTLAVGQFVYVKGHSTIPEGLRKVTASISANGSITTSNTDTCSEGGLNALNSKIATKSYAANEINISGITRSFVVNNVAYLQIYDMTRSSVSSDTTIGTLPSALTPNTYAGRGIITQTGTGKTAYINVSPNGEITCSGMEANKYYYGTIIYPLNK